MHFEFVHSADTLQLCDEGTKKRLIVLRRIRGVEVETSHEKDKGK